MIRLGMGNEDEYFWKTANERDRNPVKSSDLPKTNIMYGKLK
jgi:hypothetical protein